MPRPVSERYLGSRIPSRVMKPAGIPARELEVVTLGLDEAEALRLADLEGLYQAAAARSMGVSRPTFGRIVEAARRKVADAVLNGKALRLAGGEICVRDQGETKMKIAVPSNNGNVDEHFGHCKEYMVFEVAGGKVSSESILPSGQGCGCKSNIAAELARLGVTHLVAGNMGEGAVRVLGSNGIKVIRGASGKARAAAEAFASGAMADSGLGCAGHGEDHVCDH
jgi:predicted DNA-binding protein (UPF0251 family)/predicted Fe-Mo cluster-binding NifX family protein